MNAFRFEIARIVAIMLLAMVALAACAPQPTPTSVPPTTAPTQPPAPTSAPTQPPTASAPPGPVARYNAKFEIANPPAQFDLVYLVNDFVPGAASPVHSHGGQGYATVLDGEITIRTKDGERKFKAGETTTEIATEPVQALNTSAANTSVAVAFVLPKGAALTTSRQVGTAVPSPAQVVRYSKMFDVTNPPAQFDLIHLVQDFAPGAITPRHSHGGQGYATMLDGEITIRLLNSEKQYKAGDTFVENAGEILQVANKSAAKASFAIIFLLPKGATLTTNAP